MATPVSPLTLSTNLYARGLAMDEKNAMVYASDFGYNRLQQIMDLMNKGKSVRTDNPKFEIPKVGNTGIAQRVASNSLAGGVLTVNFTSPNKNFRLGDGIADSNQVMGRVSRLVSDYTIELEPVSVSTWVSANHFVAGSTAKVYFDISANYGSTGKSGLTVTPEYDFNYTAISRESNYIFRRDKIKTYPRFFGKYWYTSHQYFTMQRFAKSLEYKFMFSPRQVVQTVDGEAYTTGGIRWNIINNGGNYFPLSSAVTRDSWHSMLDTMGRRTANSGNRLLCLMGRDFLRSLQENVTYDPVTQTGTNNTFGGKSVQGFDVYKYAIGGVTTDWSMFPLFDDEVMFPEISAITGRKRWSHSCLFLDLTPVEAVGQAGKVPPLQRYYFGDTPYIHKYIPGMVGMSTAATSGVLQGDYEFTANSLDSSQFEILCDDGLYMIPERCGLAELIA